MNYGVLFIILILVLGPLMTYGYVLQKRQEEEKREKERQELLEAVRKGQERD